jgi:hypothetical protein
VHENADAHKINKSENKAKKAKKASKSDYEKLSNTERKLSNNSENKITIDSLDLVDESVNLLNCSLETEENLNSENITVDYSDYHNKQYSINDSCEQNQENDDHHGHSHDSHGHSHDNNGHSHEGHGHCERTHETLDHIENSDGILFHEYNNFALQNAESKGLI